MLKRAVLKVSLKEPRAKFLDMAAFIRFFGVEEAHLVHVRTSSSEGRARKADAAMRELEAAVSDLGLDAYSHVFDGHPPSMILRATRQLAADFVCICWVSKAELSQALLGSIDGDILRLCDAPIFIYNRGLTGRPAELGSVLYATDFQATDAAVMPYLINKDFQARTLYLLHSRERAPDPATDAARAAEDKADLERLAEECRHAYDKVELIEAIGSARREIVRHAKARDVDLIVAGKSDKPDPLKQLLGSTAEVLPQRARRSVFIFPGPDAEANGGAAEANTTSGEGGRS